MLPSEIGRVKRWDDGTRDGGATGYDRVTTDKLELLRRRAHNLYQSAGFQIDIIESGPARAGHIVLVARGQPS